MKISLIAIAFICLWVSAFSQTTQAKTFEISSADVLDFQFFECIDSILENYSNYKFDYYMITFMDSIDRQHCAILSPRMKGNIDIIDVSGINTLDHHVYTKFYSSEPIVESIEKGNKYGKTYIDSCAIGNVNFKPLSGIGEINVPNTAYMQESLIYVTNLCGMTIFGTNLGH
ncbi:MAG: hypothetical protein IJY30_04655, partial [Muribaculaceae bacterium]|nr:hypothetical protein [Muribaculaceae bacterium]